MKTSEDKAENSESITGQLAGSVKEGFTNVYDALTGRGLEKKLDEYTDVYGHLLLLHDSEVRKLQEENAVMKKEMAAIRRQGRMAMGICAIAALAALLVLISAVIG